jgi:hypothetical protein
MKNSKFKKAISISLFIFMVLIIFSGCARSEPVDACLEGRTYGFLYGLLHGFLAPLDLIAMFFNDKYTVYAQNNSGTLYAFGFILGSGGWGFLGGKKLCGKKN